MRDDGGRNLLLTLLSETDHSDSVIFKGDDELAKEAVEVNLHAPQTKTQSFWLCVWANCHLEKLHYCQETTSGSKDAPGYLKYPRSHWQ